MKGGATYTISKAAIEAFSRTITLEHAPQGIRSNCLKPAMIKTAMYQKAKDFAFDSNHDARLQRHKERYLLGIGETNDVAMATLFLLSSSSRWITSTELTLDGGLSPQI